jgi:hypothetical protein
MPTQISLTRGDFHFFMIVLPFEVADVVWTAGYMGPTGNRCYK